MRILITGGAGYVGTVFVKTLLSSGHEIRCLDHRRIDLPALLNLNEAERNRHELRVGDICNPHDLASAMDKMDAVVHLAAVVGSPACDANPQAAKLINVDGTRAVALATPRNLPLICMSTCSVYGGGNILCRETDPIHPLTLYGETKAISERIIIDRGGVVLRATTAYGPSPYFRWDLIIHTFVRLGLTGGRLKLFEPRAIRPFIHVEDMAKALVFGIQHFASMRGEIYNVGSDDSTLTKLDLAQRIGALTGLAIEINEMGRDPDGRNYRVDFNRIEQLGYRTSHSLDTGLKETVEWIRAATLRERAS